MTHTYHGRRAENECVVTKDGAELNPRLDLWAHSPTGLEWGYGGSGPAQLALALLADVLEDPREAVRLHQNYKWAVVAKLPHVEWTLDSDQVRAMAFRLAAALETTEDGRR